MTDFKRVVHCGIDFNLMEKGDSEYREKCLKQWLEGNCTSSYRYEWSSMDEFTVYFDSEHDYQKSSELTESGIPHAS